MSRPVPLRHEGHPVQARLTLRGAAAVLERAGRRIEARIAREGPWIEITGASGTVRAAALRDARGVWVALAGRTYFFDAEHRPAEGADAAATTGEVRASMTGRILAVETKPGSPAREGDLLLTIEAMKMEFKVIAPANGMVAKVLCAEGDRVELGQLLVRIDASDAAVDGAPPAGGALG